MTDDDILRMAREAGLSDSNGVVHAAYQLERFASLVSAIEREECAKVCDGWPNGRDDVFLLANAIRARGEK